MLHFLFIFIKFINRSQMYICKELGKTFAKVMLLSKTPISKLLTSDNALFKVTVNPQGCLSENRSCSHCF